MTTMRGSRSKTVSAVPSELLWWPVFYRDAATDRSQEEHTQDTCVIVLLVSQVLRAARSAKWSGA
jgi:hypothetical protein